MERKCFSWCLCLLGPGHVQGWTRYGFFGDSALCSPLSCSAHDRTQLYCSWQKQLLPQHPRCSFVFLGPLCSSKGACCQDLRLPTLTFSCAAYIWSTGGALMISVLPPLGIQVAPKCHLHCATAGCFSLLWQESGTCLPNLLPAGNKFKFSEWCHGSPMVR